MCSRCRAPPHLQHIYWREVHPICPLTSSLHLSRNPVGFWYFWRWCWLCRIWPSVAAQRLGSFGGGPSALHRPVGNQANHPVVLALGFGLEREEAIFLTTSKAGNLDLMNGEAWISSVGHLEL